MTLDRAIFAFAGVIVLGSLALAYFVHPYWIGLTAFAGLNLLQSAFTGYCPAVLIFKRLGFKPGAAFK